ncbi:MAG: hypothetical protein JST79_08825 [Acidobacteria bacterium]|nr:hypothetical protein [Acidobacteriota bacterium]
MNLLELFFQRAQAQSSATKLLDAAAEAKRDLTATEQVEFERLTGKVSTLDRQIEERAALAEVHQ